MTSSSAAPILLLVASTAGSVSSPNASSPSSLSSFHPRPSASRSSLDRPPAPAPAHARGRRTCMCSPTTHPGSFRCSLHKGTRISYHHAAAAAAGSASASQSIRLNARRSAVANSLVRSGAVEGGWAKRALAALILPSSHQQRRRLDFRPRPTRLSVMSKAVDAC